MDGIISMFAFCLYRGRVWMTLGADIEPSHPCIHAERHLQDEKNTPKYRRGAKVLVNWKDSLDGKKWPPSWEPKRFVDKPWSAKQAGMKKEDWFQSLTLWVEPELEEKRQKEKRRKEERQKEKRQKEERQKELDEKVQSKKEKRVQRKLSDRVKERGLVPIPHSVGRARAGGEEAEGEEAEGGEAEGEEAEGEEAEGGEAEGEEAEGGETEGGEAEGEEAEGGEAEGEEAEGGEAEGGEAEGAD
jgi:hypothetical protein